MMTAKKRAFLIFLVIVTVAMTMLAACQKPGEADKSFTFVAEIDGIKRTETIKTVKNKVGDALVDEGYIVNGTGANTGMFFSVFGFGSEAELNAMSTAVSGVYWGFYINGEFATAGIFDTEIENGATYTAKFEKWDLSTFG